MNIAHIISQLGQAEDCRGHKHCSFSFFLLAFHSNTAEAITYTHRAHDRRSQISRRVVETSAAETQSDQMDVKDNKISLLDSQIEASRTDSRQIFTGLTSGC